MPTSLGPAEILVILVVALIVLGPNRLPEAGRQVGRALAEVRRWTRDVQGEIRSAIDPDAPAATTASTASTVTTPAAAEPRAASALYPPPVEAAAGPSEVVPDAAESVATVAVATGSEATPTVEAPPVEIVPAGTTDDLAVPQPPSGDLV